MPEDLRTADEPPVVSVSRVLRLTVEYAGTHFAGWQVQPQARTVQGELERALAVVLREPVRLTGASRTDAGVHALGQVASFATRSDASLARIQSGLNALLPGDVAVRAVAEAPEGWSARFQARGKHYRYRLLEGRTRSPTEAETSWHVMASLDVEAMQDAAQRLVGTHDFVALATKGAPSDPERSTVRTIHDVRVVRQPGAPWGDTGGERPIFAIDVVGDGFLYKMVRTIAGTLVQVGKGRRAPASIDAVLAGRDRRAAGPAAPPQGLYLMRVFYDDAQLKRPFHSSSEGVSREGDDHGSSDERPRLDPDVRGGEGRQARSLLRSAP